MVNDKFAKDQIARLSAQPFFHTISATGLNELRDTVMRVAMDEAHARRMIDKALELKDENGRSAMATCADLSRIAFETRGKSLQPDPECPKCNGIGQIIRQFTLPESHPLRNIYGDAPITGAAKCDCYTLRPARDDYGELVVPKVAAGDCEIRVPTPRRMR